MSSPQIHMWIRGTVQVQACVRDECELDAGAGCRHRLFWGLPFSKGGGRKKSTSLLFFVSHVHAWDKINLYLCHYRWPRKSSTAQILASSVLSWLWGMYSTWHYALSSMTLVAARALFILENQIVQIMVHFSCFLFDKMDVLHNIKGKVCCYTSKCWSICKKK